MKVNCKSCRESGLIKGNQRAITFSDIFHKCHIIKTFMSDQRLPINSKFYVLSNKTIDAFKNTAWFVSYYAVI